MINGSMQVCKPVVQMRKLRGVQRCSIRILELKGSEVLQSPHSTRGGVRVMFYNMRDVLEQQCVHI